MEKSNFDPNDALREMNEAFLDAETNEFFVNLAQRYKDAREADHSIIGKGFEVSYLKVTSSKVAQVECYKITLTKPHNPIVSNLPERFFGNWQQLDIEIPVYYFGQDPEFVFTRLVNDDEQKNFVVSKHRIIELDLERDDLRFVENENKSGTLYIGHLRDIEGEGEFKELDLEPASEEEINKRIEYISLLNALTQNYKIADQSR